jgi:cell wall-associated NlpC family hydrolase
MFHLTQTILGVKQQQERTTIKMKKIIALVFIVLLVFTPVVSASVQIIAEAKLLPFNWVVNGKKIESNGVYFNGTNNVPTSVNIGGSTYIPIRLAGESLGFNVSWDSKTQTATLTKEPEVVVVEKIVEVPAVKEVQVVKEVEKIAYVSVPEWEIKANKVIEEGQKHLEVPYLFGAKSEVGYTEYFDCSSFTRYAYYNALGMELPRNSRQQSTEGTKVSRAETRKGDLMFFDTKGDGVIDHVAIYMGDGRLLHSSPSGKGVNIQSLSSFWERTYVVTKRVIQ